MKRGTRIGLVILGIIGIGFAYRVLSVYQFHAGDCVATPEIATRPPTYPRRLVVMTYNVQGHAALIRSNHIEKIAETINKVHPDIVAINEAHTALEKLNRAVRGEQLKRLSRGR